MNVYRDRDCIVFLSGFIVAFLVPATTDFLAMCVGHGWTASQALLDIGDFTTAPLLAGTDSLRHGASSLTMRVVHS